MRVGFCRERANLFFMFRVGPGVHKAHGDGVDFVLFHQAADRGHDIVPVERHDFVTLIVHAFAHADHALSGNERFRLGNPGHVLDLITGEPVDPPDGTHDLGGVFEAFGGDEPDFAAVVRDQRVGRDRATVLEQRSLAEQFAGFHADGSCGLFYGVHHAARKIVRCGRRFRGPNFARVAEHNDVGKRPAGVDADNELFFCRHGMPFE